MNPLISVIVPIAKMSGKLRYLDEWLQAIDKNVYQVILVHDVQDLETEPELEALIKKIVGKKPTLISGKFGSPGSARNEGLQYVEGKWIAFWDSDDQPNHIEFQKMVEQAENKSLKIAIGGFSKTDVGTGFIKSVHFPGLPNKGSNIPFEPGIWRWAFLKQEINSLRFPDLRMGEDQVFLSEVGYSENQVHVHNYSVYSYSLNRSGQLTSDRTALFDLSKAMKIELENYRKKKLPMESFMISILLKQCITAIKSIKVELVAQALLVLFALIKDAITNRNDELFKSIKACTKYLLQRNNQPHLQTFFALGGLGNQLFQVAAGLSVSRNSNFYLDYSHGPAKKNQIDLTHDFYLPERILVSKRLELGILRMKVFNLCIRFSAASGNRRRNRKSTEILRKSLEGLLRFVGPGGWKINLGTGFDPEVALCQKQYMLGYFQTFHYFSDAQVQNLLQRIRLKNPSTTFMKDQSELKDKNSLIVHVRLGDYLRESRFGQLSPEYFHAVIQAAWNTGGFNQICLFSDEPILAVKFLPPELQHMIWTPNINLTSAAETFELMRHGKGYVLSNSSFSWWAAALAYEGSPLVIAPKPWFEDEIDPIDLIPEDWVTVSKLDFASAEITL
jgi:glycosyltransferase involved in cell wall biosynthesis